MPSVQFTDDGSDSSDGDDDDDAEDEEDPVAVVEVADDREEEKEWGGGWGILVLEKGHRRGRQDRVGRGGVEYYIERKRWKVSHKLSSVLLTRIYKGPVLSEPVFWIVHATQRKAPTKYNASSEPGIFRV